MLMTCVHIFHYREWFYARQMPGSQKMIHTAAGYLKYKSYMSGTGRLAHAKLILNARPAIQSIRALLKSIVSYDNHSHKKRMSSFSISTPLSRNPRCPTFHGFIRKTKVLNNSSNQFIYNFYPQNILVLEECLQKWWNKKLDIVPLRKRLSFRKRKLLETVTYIAIKTRLHNCNRKSHMCLTHCKKYLLHNCNRNSHLPIITTKNVTQIFAAETVTCICVQETSNCIIAT